MPIGKNAIKRVINNGYSNVKTSAPDMENSVIEEPKKPAVKKTPAKNPVPKGVTSTGKVPSSSRKNRAPRAAILPEGVIPKKSAAKPAPVKVAFEPVEVKEEKTAEVKEELTETTLDTTEATVEVKEEVKSEETAEETVAAEEVNGEETAGEAVTAEEVNDEQLSSESLKSMEREPELAPVRTFEKVTEKNERTGDGYVNLGAALPYYLLKY